ncbi:MAG: sensor histidine kinase [Paludibacteraceae bacterium]
MKKLLQIVLGVTLLCSGLLFSSCRRFEHDGKRLQRQIYRQQTLAESKTADLVRILQQSSNFDSIKLITSHNDDNIQFYIFDSRRLVYWSDNWLSSDDVLLSAYDRWDYYRFRNAHVLGRWTKAGMYNVLTILPLKYAYPVEGLQMRNTFVPPFRCRADYDLTRRRSDDYYEIDASDGRYLFSLAPKALTPNTAVQSPAEESFSFQQLFDQDDDGEDYRSAVARVQIYFIFTIVFFVVIILVGLWGLIHCRGFNNMKLRTRLMYVVITCVLTSFIYIFVMSIRYVRTNYEHRQQETLQSKCRFAQIYLQSLYYWDISLTPANTTGLNVDLRDISFTAGVDIHVFDNHGQLVGSSTPGLFTEGLLSTRIAPEPFFSSEHTMVQYEPLGSTRYLCAYIPFYNGSFVQIGYIAVPSFISEIEKSQEVDNLLARLLPPYLIVLFLALFASYWAARGMTASLSMLTEKMHHFRIGRSDNHIKYIHRDEVGELVERYNAMVDQVEESAARLAKAEREDAWRTMARQIAHEINNPLTPMKLTIQQLQRTKGTERFDAYFDKATKMLIDQMDNLSRIAVSFSTFAKQPEVTVSEVDVALKLTNVITLLRNNTEQVPIRYVGPDHGVAVWADAKQISQVFTNILRNAMQAMEGQENADIIVILKEVYSPEMIEISFSDNGPGIPEDIQSRVFMPNFTTKNTGMGLGLAISKNIVEGTGGKICFETSEKGTTFFVYLRKKL